MPKSKIFLPDVNVWIALASARHVHNGPAARWIGHLDREQAAFCRVTQMGMLRLLTNRRVMDDDVLTQEGAWKAYDRIRADDRIRFAAEPANLDEAWRQVSRASKSTPNLWTDTYLLSFAQTAGFHLVTFDHTLVKLDKARVELLIG